MIGVLSSSRQTGHRSILAACLALAAAVALVAASIAGGFASIHSGGLRPLVSRPITIQRTAGALPTTSECLDMFGVHCYSPAQLDDAYNLNGLHRAGIDGRGRTIVIVDAFGSPTIAADLHTFDQEWGLPDPSLTIIQPAGPVPPFDQTNSDMVG
jgi:subtilase family serine protease